MPITKHNYLVKSAGELRQGRSGSILHRRYRRQGPVLIDIPKDVGTRQSEDVKLPEKVTLRGYNPTYKGHKRQIEKALEMLGHAERPLIYAGEASSHPMHRPNWSNLQRLHRSRSRPR